jgi:hypothetical protein
MDVSKCNKTQSKWCINKHGASKIIDLFEMYHASPRRASLPLTAAPRRSPLPLLHLPSPTWPPRHGLSGRCSSMAVEAHQDALLRAR